MSFALVYLAQRFVFRATDFFHRWYMDGSRSAIHALTRALERADRRFAVASALAEFSAPPWSGVFLRATRIAIGSALYAAIMLIFLVGFVFWLAIPLALPFLMMQTIRP